MTWLRGNELRPTIFTLSGRNYFFWFILIQSLFDLQCNGGVGKEREYGAAFYERYERDFPAKTPLRATKVRDLKAQLAARQSIFTKPKTQANKAATVASYRISHVLAKHKKPFIDGNIVKEAFLKAAFLTTLKIKQRS